MDEPDDPLIDEVIAKALEGYEHVLPAPELAAMRQVLRDELLFTPQGQRELREIRRARAGDRSGEVRKDDDGARTTQDAAPRGIKKGA